MLFVLKFSGCFMCTHVPRVVCFLLSILIGIGFSSMFPVVVTLSDGIKVDTLSYNSFFLQQVLVASPLS